MNVDANGRVLLIGRGATSLSALEGLVSMFEVCAMVRDGDDMTTQRARELGVAVVGDTSIRGIRDAIQANDPDAVVVSSYDRILDAELISARPFVNVHYAPLPRGRGRATVNWAIINGDTSTAITIHHLVPELDAGGILFQSSVPIDADSSVTSLYAALNDLQRQHIVATATLAAIAGDPGTPQVDEHATYCCTRTPDDGEIDWSAPSAEVGRLVRALQPPFPSAFTWLGLQRLHIDEAHVVTDGRVYEGRIPGRVVAVDRVAGTADVLTGDGSFRIHKVRLDDGPQVDAATVLLSVRATLGLTLADVVGRIRTIDGPTTRDG